MHVAEAHGGSVHVAGLLGPPEPGHTEKSPGAPAGAEKGQQPACALDRDPGEETGPQPLPPPSLLGDSGAAEEAPLTSAACVCGHVSKRAWWGVRRQSG